FLSLLRTATATTAGTADGTERWGYVEVRPSKSGDSVTNSSLFVSVFSLLTLLGCAGRCRGSPVLVVLQEPPGPEGVHAHQAMADRPLAAGWPGSVGRRARQLPGGRAAQRRPEATQLDMAAQGRPHLRGQPSRRRVQLRGGRQPAGDHRPAGGGGHDHAAQGPRQGADDLAEQPAVHRRRVVRRQVRRHARRLRRPGRPRRRAQAHARRRGARRQLDLAGGFRVFVRDALVPGVEAGSQRRRPRKQGRTGGEAAGRSGAVQASAGHTQPNAQLGRRQQRPRGCV
uniref:Uncharacterized protein n=1 Tax=Aegilops tauschii subsp. strangulata TaxID=200361 RepID=A0A452ZJ86_AEGTS